MMMIVVPALTEGDQSEEEVVSAGVGRLIPARAKQVREGIDGEGTVPDEHGVQEKAPDEQRPTAYQPESDGESDGRHEMIFVQPAQFGEFGKVADITKASIVVFVGNDPADVRLEKTEQRGRMQILSLV